MEKNFYQYPLELSRGLGIRLVINLLLYKMEYDFEDFKYNNKIDLCNKFGIEFDPTIPVFGLILDVNEYEAIDYFMIMLRKYSKMKI